MLKQILNWIKPNQPSTAERPVQRWETEKLDEVKSYLENKDPRGWSREDNYLAAEFVIQRYLPNDSGKTQNEYDLAIDNIRKKIDKNIDFPDAPKEEIKDDPDFAAWLDEHLK